LQKDYDSVKIEVHGNIEKFEANNSLQH